MSDLLLVLYEPIPPPMYELFSCCSIIGVALHTQERYMYCRSSVHLWFTVKLL